MITHELDTEEVKRVLRMHLNDIFPNNPVNVIEIRSTATFPDEMHPLLIVRAHWDEVLNGKPEPRRWWEYCVIVLTMGFYVPVQRYHAPKPVESNETGFSL